MRWITRAACWRLAVLLLLLATAAVTAWWTMLRMPLHSHAGPLPPLSPAQRQLARELRAHVQLLAGEIGERSLRRPQALALAAQAIERALGGYTVERQTFAVGELACANLIAERRGHRAPEQIVVIGAHYDTVADCPGANDNASGVAALLALAQRQVARAPARTLRFVAFVNEEPPFFQQEGMGSVVYAARCRARGEQVVAMLSLETLGCYRSEPGSQRYPGALASCFPDRGDFVALVGDVQSGELVRRCLAAFRAHAAFPSEGAALPASLPGVGWSDHWAFWQQGYPALMVTDTAPFRYQHYHQPTDTPDRVDCESLARVVEGLDHVLRELVDG